MSRALLSRLYLNRICSIVRTSCVSNSLTQTMPALLGRWSMCSICQSANTFKSPSSLKKELCWWPSCSVHKFPPAVKADERSDEFSPFCLLLLIDDSFWFSCDGCPFLHLQYRHALQVCVGLASHVWISMYCMLYWNVRENQANLVPFSWCMG